MVGADLDIRPARAEEAADIARLVNAAGTGVALQMWQAYAPEGVDAWDFAAGFIAEHVNSPPYADAWVAVQGGRVAGFLSARRLAPEPEPPMPEAPPFFAPFFAPVFALEALACDTGYVNMLAVTPQMRGQGTGSRLLGFAERYQGPGGMSLVVADSNTGAKRLYDRVGYRVTAHRAMVNEGWDFGGKHWLLMRKPARGPGGLQ